MDKILIIGSGNGGLALAGHLKLQGCYVTIWAPNEHTEKLNEIKNHNNIIELQGAICGKAKIDKIFDNFEEAVASANIIYNCQPMFAHENLLTNLNNSSNSELLIINLSGTFSSLAYFNKNVNATIKHKLFDAATFPYACRYIGENKVVIYAVKKFLPIAPLFNCNKKYLVNIPFSARPTEFFYQDSPIKTALSGVNIRHPATVLFNAARIDKSESNFYFYKDGISKNTAKLHESLEKERQLLGKIMGFDLAYSVCTLNKYYNTNFKNIYDFYTNSQIHNQDFLTPSSLQHRYIYEDVKCGLVALYSLAKNFNLELPNIKSVIQIFSTISSENFFVTGRALTNINENIIREFNL